MVLLLMWTYLGELWVQCDWSVCPLNLGWASDHFILGAHFSRRDTSNRCFTLHQSDAILNKNAFVSTSWASGYNSHNLLQDFLPWALVKISASAEESVATKNNSRIVQPCKALTKMGTANSLVCDLAGPRCACDSAFFSSLSFAPFILNISQWCCATINNITRHFPDKHNIKFPLVGQGEINDIYCMCILWFSALLYRVFKLYSQRVKIQPPYMISYHVQFQYI